MTDAELVNELLKRLTENRRKAKCNLNYNKIISLSIGCISIENLRGGETIDFLFQNGKIMGIGS